MNLGTGHSVTIRELAFQIMQAADRKVNVNEMPPREGDIPHSMADIARADRILGWEPKVPLLEGLRELVSGVKV